ncbi:amino acid ABC transporter ATP-binding protein [Actinomadura luteofluorescens]|uniref:ABC-type polar-amino-acid transporter n=1 Tax=Actinomadura luteofluorescens TaxID=46163 RepID=A0A7Y9EPR0_9ACTN|nr:amino acid ABC transporter ATP-binding protein [Actinomadura luteofluorescens]NYD51678.1 ABC-type polar amino acid transport system ATPase subunit [Actinomadura luteofluorescens]
MLVQIRGATKAFGPLAVFQDVDLDVRQSEVVVLIGPSGAGKSTLLRCVNGLERLDAGTIDISGERLSYQPGPLNRIRRNVGMVFQNFNLFPHMTVLGNVMCAPVKVAGGQRDKVREEAHQLLDKVGLSDKCDAFPSSLSGGQRQRVAIARALAMRPQLMLFDEPTSALDPELVGEVLEVMRTLAAEGMTMLVVTHEMQFARKVADRVVLVADGGIIEQGRPQAVLDEPATPRARAFLRAVLER